MLARRLYTVAAAVALLGAAACEAEPEVGEGEVVQTAEDVTDPAGEVVEGGPTGQARGTGPGTTPPVEGAVVDTAALP